jgi:hypothetical protein
MTDGMYQAAPVVAVAGWTLFMAEYISTLLMLPWTFRFGLPVWRRELPVGSLRTLLDTENVTVKGVGPSEWVFRRKFSLFDFQSPFPIRGSIRNGRRGTVVVGRQPVGGGLFLLGWAVFMGAPVGPLAAVGMYAVSWLIERARFDQAWRELSAAVMPDSSAPIAV